MKYLDNAEVRSFLQWAGPFWTGERPLQRRWKSRKWGEWSCNSLFDAYIHFEWPFTVKLPGESQREGGRSFDQNATLLERLRQMLRDSRDREDADEFLNAAIAVVDWGGVRGNIPRLKRLGSAALSQISSAARQLDPKQADTGELESVVHMNSGFSKIYSLLVDCFPIYDSRVACALAFLVRQHCEEFSLQRIPPSLAFRIPANQGRTHRDPSSGTLGFQRLWAGRPKDYAISNLMAAWLLEPLSQMGRFGELSADRRLLAVESALFMIGYETPPV